MGIVDYYNNKHILVTGASGLIGSALVRALMSSDSARVTVLGRNRGRLEKAFAAYLCEPRFNILAQDVCDPLDLVLPVDLIFHAAGPMESRVIRERPLDVIRPNIDGTINCLELLRRQKESTARSGRLFLFSSVTVYGNGRSADISVREDQTALSEVLDSVSAPYSQSKRLSEVIVRAYGRQHGIDSVIGRFSTVYGPTPFYPETAFYEFIRKASAGEKIAVLTAGLPRRDNIYIDDAVCGALTVAALGESLEAYNISSNGDLGNFAAVDEIAGIIAAQAGCLPGHAPVSVRLAEDASAARRPGLKLDNSRLKALGWGLGVSLQDGIRRTLEQYDQAVEG